MSESRERAKDEERWEDRPCPACGGHHMARIRPAYQYYPSDEQNETTLKTASLAARGLWHEMLNFMHFAIPRGWLVTAAGKTIGPEQLARLVGESPAIVKKLLGELEDNGVFSRTDSGIIYSRRMVRDEHIMNVRAASGAKGGNPKLVKQNEKKGSSLLNQSSKQNPTPSSSSSSSSSPAPSAAANGERRAEGQAARPAPQVLLAAAANRGIHERWGEQLNPIRHDAGASHELAAVLQSAGVSVDFACDAVYTCVKESSSLDHPPKSLKYFRGYILDRWRASEEHERAASSGAKALPAMNGSGDRDVTFTEVAARMAARAEQDLKGKVER